MIEPTLAPANMNELTPAHANLTEAAAQAMSAGVEAAWKALQHKAPFGCRIAITSGSYGYHMHQGQQEGENRKNAHLRRALGSIEGSRKSPKRN